MSQDRKTGILSLFSEYILFFGGKVKKLITGFRTLSTFKGLIPFYRLHFKAMFIFGICISQFQSLSLTSLRLEHQVKYRSKVLFWRFKGYFICYFSFIILFALFYLYYSDEYLLRAIYVVRSKVAFEMDMETDGRRI